MVRMPYESYIFQPDLVMLPVRDTNRFTGKYEDGLPIGYGYLPPFRKQRKHIE